MGEEPDGLGTTILDAGAFTVVLDEHIPVLRGGSVGDPNSGGANASDVIVSWNEPLAGADTWHGGSWCGASGVWCAVVQRVLLLLCTMLVSVSAVRVALRQRRGPRALDLRHPLHSWQRLWRTRIDTDAEESGSESRIDSVFRFR